MSVDIGLLLLTAASIGFIHTLLGPDHYLPFVAMGAARGWTTRRTLWITALCGVGHVLGSVVIGLVGIGVGVSLYMAWGLKKAWRSRPHTHDHVHTDGTKHLHEHHHEHAHVHPHVSPATARSITPWALFVIFVLGPCEPLIPVLMYPAAQHSLWGTVAVVMTFGAATVATMLTVVYLAQRGLERLPLEPMERYSHALAGAALSLCGAGIVFLGL
jgi:nickel/cobalt transporter (NicO) family protein